MNGNQVPGLTILSHTEVVAQVPAGRVPELRLDWDWDWEALLVFVTGGC
jgi:hypothetical protein